MSPKASKRSAERMSNNSIEQQLSLKAAFAGDDKLAYGQREKENVYIPRGKNLPHPFCSFSIVKSAGVCRQRL